MSKSTEFLLAVFYSTAKTRFFWCHVCLSIQLYIESPNMLLLTLWKGIFICGSDCLFNSYWIYSYTKNALSNVVYYTGPRQFMFMSDNFIQALCEVFKYSVKSLGLFSEVCTGVCGYLACWLGGDLSDIISCTVADCLCPQHLAWMVSLPVILINQLNKNLGWKIWWFVATSDSSEEGSFWCMRYFHLAFLSFCSTYLASITLHFWDPRPHIKYLLRVQST